MNDKDYELLERLALSALDEWQEPETFYTALDPRSRSGGGRVGALDQLDYIESQGAPDDRVSAGMRLLGRSED